MLAAIAHRHEGAERAADHLLGRVAEEPLRRGIHEENDAVLVDGDDGILRALRQHTIELAGIEWRSSGHAYGR